MARKHKNINKSRGAGNTRAATGFGKHNAFGSAGAGLKGKRKHSRKY